MLNDTTALVNFIVANYCDEDGYGLTAKPEHWAEYGITTIPQLQLYLIKCDIWEVYKTAHGFRPRHMDLWSDSWSMEDLQELMQETAAAAERELDEDAARKQKAIEDFEATIQRTIEIGAGDRQTAFRWMTQDYEATQGYIEWDFGVPYGTFDEFFPQEQAA
jgi:hypothetical protein